MFVFQLRKIGAERENQTKLRIYGSHVPKIPNRFQCHRISSYLALILLSRLVKVDFFDMQATLVTKRKRRNPRRDPRRDCAPTGAKLEAAAGSLPMAGVAAAGNAAAACPESFPSMREWLDACRGGERRDGMLKRRRRTSPPSDDSWLGEWCSPTKRRHQTRPATLATLQTLTPS